MADKAQSSGKNTPTAFVIVNGARVVILDQPVTKIGRKKDNHIVVNNEFVSRYHAQIQSIEGQYFIVDLKSTVGTSVNGERVQHTLLKPGDVISLGGVPLIFGLGTPKNPGSAPLSEWEKFVGTGPTDALDIRSADQYLDLFKPKDES
jgi:pSer/pThr/pTyr-binding forkhead associated (FHA) protein